MKRRVRYDTAAACAPGRPDPSHTGDHVKTDTESHLRMTQRRKEGHEKKQAAADHEKGLLIVNTGNGKGKTTAAFGMAVRVLGHGMKLGVVQFIKGALHTSERDFLGAIANCDFVTMGDGYTWNTQNREADMATARKGWNEARTHDRKRRVSDGRARRTERRAQVRISAAR